jgi:hypothetical protein
MGEISVSFGEKLQTEHRAQSKKNKAGLYFTVFLFVLRERSLDLQ